MYEVVQKYTENSWNTSWNMTNYATLALHTGLATKNTSTLSPTLQWYSASPPLKTGTNSTSRDTSSGTEGKRINLPIATQNTLGTLRTPLKNLHFPQSAWLITKTPTKEDARDPESTQKPMNQ